MFRHADSVPVVLREASWRCPSSGWSREGEGTPEDILARLADGKHRFEEDESKLISHGKSSFTDHDQISNPSIYRTVASRDLKRNIQI